MSPYCSVMPRFIHANDIKRIVFGVLGYSFAIYYASIFTTAFYLLPFGPLLDLLAWVAA